MLHPKKKSVRLCVCSTNLGFSGGSANRYCCTYYVPDTYVPHFMIPGTYYVRDTYDTRYVLCTRYVRMYHTTCRCTINSTAVSLFVYSLVGGGITRTFRSWTHTSDDSYIYQLSLVVATATVSFILLCKKLLRKLFLYLFSSPNPLQPQERSSLPPPNTSEEASNDRLVLE